MTSVITYNIRNAYEQEEKFYEFTNLSLIKELGIDESYFENKCNLNRFDLYGQYTDTEKNFLYSFIRKIKPKGILEFSPCQGYTTCVMGTALRDEEVKFDFFESFELDKDCYEKTKSNLLIHDIKNIKVINGDVLKCMDPEKLKKCDLMFIDCNHDKFFARQYVDKFFPLLPKGTWVMVHDIVFSVKNEETVVIQEYLEEHNINDYFYVPDVLRYLGVDDYSLNVLGSRNREYSTSLWFRI